MALTELLLYAVFAGFVLLFNLLTQWLSRRRQGQADEAGDEAAAPDQAQGTGVGPRPPPEPIRVLWEQQPPPPVPAPSIEELPFVRPLGQRAAEVLAPAAAGARRSRARLKLGSRKELRQAFITMTILKPCRALEPFEADNDRPARL